MKPLPYRNPDRVVSVMEGNPAKNQRVSLVSPARLADWNQLSSTFEMIAGLYAENMTDTSSSEPERLVGRRVSPGFFRVLSIPLLAGRTFLPIEETFGGPQAALISEGLWTRRYHRDTNIAGTRLRLAGAACTIVGVLPKAFTTPAIDVWMPAQLDSKIMRIRDARFYTGLGRMKPGVTIEQAQADLRRVCERLGEIYPKTDKGWSPVVADYKQYRTSAESRPLTFIFAAAALLLLILCANIAGLLLGQLQRRERELAIRASLGAGRKQIAAVALREVALLAACSAVLGLALAYGGTVMLGRLFDSLPRIQELRFDWRIALFTIALSAATALVFGVLPAIQATRRDLNALLAQSGRTQAGVRQSWQQMMVGAQFAVTLVLLAGAGLLLRSYYNLTRVEGGFQAAHAIMFHVGAGWNEDRASVGLFQEQLIQELEQLPSVTAAGLTNSLPGSSATLRQQVSVEGVAQAGNDGQILAGTRDVTAGYLRALHVPLLEGAFCPAFRVDPNAKPKVLVNQRFAQVAGGANLVGRHLKWTGFFTLGVPEIAGVTGDVKEDGLSAPAAPYVYICLTPGAWADPEYVIAAGGDTRGLVNAVGQVVHKLAPQRALFGVSTVTEYVNSTLDRPRLTAGLLGAFAASALLSAALGLYGLVMLMIASRAKEFGVRMAMGAAPVRIVRDVVWAAVRPLLGAAVAGLAIALAVLRLFRPVFFEVTPWDLLTFSLVCALLFGVALAAALLASRRAARIEPIEALRSE